MGQDGGPEGFSAVGLPRAERFATLPGEQLAVVVPPQAVGSGGRWRRLQSC